MAAGCTTCQQQATADLVSSNAPTAVAVLGDNQYQSGTYAEYTGTAAFFWLSTLAKTCSANGRTATRQLAAVRSVCDQSRDDFVSLGDLILDFVPPGRRLPEDARQGDKGGDD